MNPETLVALGETFAQHDPAFSITASSLRLAAAVLAGEAEAARVKSAVVPGLSLTAATLTQRAADALTMAQALELIAQGEVK